VRRKNVIEIFRQSSHSIAIVGIEKKELCLLPVGADKSAFLII